MNSQKDVFEAVRKTFQSGVIFTPMDIEAEDMTPKQISNALGHLARKGVVKRGPIKGQFYVNGSMGLPPQPINPAQAIYDLLEFMAKAEAPLKRAARILEAVDKA
jgi:hypothetical protein